MDEMEIEDRFAMTYPCFVLGNRLDDGRVEALLDGPVLLLFTDEHLAEDHIERTGMQDQCRPIPVDSDEVIPMIYSLRKRGCRSVAIDPNPKASRMAVWSTEDAVKMILASQP